MCGRMTLTPRDFGEVAAMLGVDPDADPELAAAYRPRFNLPPTDPHLMIVGPDARRLVQARWGFGRDPRRPQINARGETVAKNGLFRRAFQERRCLVPADGFYEWVGGPGKRRPVWFHAPPGQLLLFAGIYDDGGFAVVTCAAGEDVAPVHDRMPVLLVGADADRWLAAPDPSLLRPAPRGTLVVTPVSTRVNSVAHDDEACLAPPADEAPAAAEVSAPAQLRLL
jgi:putative SOS response-associated peptidase YedK